MEYFFLHFAVNVDIMNVMTKKTVIQLSMKGAFVEETSEMLRRAATHFHKHDFVKLPLFLSDDILRFAEKNISTASFYSKKHSDIATELCMKTNSLIMLLTALMNDYKVFRLIDKITDCGPIGCFTGRIYRMKAGDHYDSWHDDLIADRKVAISVNLSEKVYQGGCLMMRYKKKPTEIIKVPNTGFGDAIIFRLGKDMEHQVSNLRGKVPKTAYAGWFRTRPDYLKSVKKIKSKIQ